MCELLDRVHGPNGPLVAVAQYLREVVEAIATSDAAVVMKVAGDGSTGHKDRAHVADVALLCIARINPAAFCLASMEANLAILATTLPFVESNENNVLPWLFETLFLAHIPGLNTLVQTFLSTTCPSPRPLVRRRDGYVTVNKGKNTCHMCFKLYLRVSKIHSTNSRLHNPCVTYYLNVVICPERTLKP